MNLGLLCLALSNLRVAMSNLRRYGVLADPIEWLRLFIGNPYSWPCLLLMLLLNVCVAAAVLIERMGASRVLGAPNTRLLHALNIAVTLLFPIGFLLYIKPHPLGSAVCLFHALILSAKLVSYEQVNRRLRRGLRDRAGKAAAAAASRSRVHTAQETRDGSSCCESDVSTTAVTEQDSKRRRYPQNLTFGNMYFFLAVPTLCYELEYPRAPRLRKSFLLRRVAESVLFGFMIAALAQQWVRRNYAPAVCPWVRTLRRQCHPHRHCRRLRPFWRTLSSAHTFPESLG